VWSFSSFYPELLFFCFFKRTHFGRSIVDGIRGVSRHKEVAELQDGGSSYGNPPRLPWGGNLKSAEQCGQSFFIPPHWAQTDHHCLEGVLSQHTTPDGPDQLSALIAGSEDGNTDDLMTRQWPTRGNSFTAKTPRVGRSKSQESYVKKRTVRPTYTS